MTNNYKLDNQNIYTPSADVATGYIQTKKNQLFIGQGEVLSFDKTAYYILRNPSDSDVNIFVRTIFLSNNSALSVSAKIIYYSKVSGDLKKSTSIASGNTYDTCPNNKGIILSGIDMSVKNGVEVITHNLPPYHSYRTQAQGSVLIAPGMNHVVKITPLNCGGSGTCIVGFGWWEEPILSQNYNCN